MNKSQNLSAEQQLITLRGMAERFGFLHEAQILQIKLWPFSVDPKLKSSTAEIDIEHTSILYNWVGNGVVNAKYLQRVNTLHDTVRHFFGDGWEIQILLNEKAIYPIAAAPKKKASKKPAKKPAKKNANKIRKPVTTRK